MDASGNRLQSTGTAVFPQALNDGKQGGYAAQEQHQIELTIDEKDLARWGKRQQLKRNFRMFSSLGLVCTLVITWEALTVVVGGALANGGPGGAVYQYICVWIGTTLQTLVMAELGSMMPLAGGMYNWTAILAPESSSKFLSYMVGWFTILAWVPAIAAGGLLGGTQIQGMAALAHPSYTPTRWQTTLLIFAVITLCMIFNTITARILPQIESVTFMLHIAGFIAIMVPLLHLGDHVSAEDVFTRFLNTGGWSSQGLSWFVGLTPVMFSFVGTDAPCHIAEEIHNARVVIPWSMVWSVAINGILGFAMLLALLFCLGDVQSVLATPTGISYIQIYYNATQSVGGTIAMSSVIVGAQVMASVACLASVSRLIWAFARENALPFSNWLKRIEPRTTVPLNAIFVCITAGCLLALINIGSTAVFSALTSLTVAGVYAAYIVTAAVYLYRLFRPDERLHWGAFTLGRSRIPILVASLIYTAIGFFFSFWPPAINPTAVSMNWASAVFGGVALFAILFWFVHSMKRYHGPIMELRVDDVVVVVEEKD